jgi:hypothetical protein
MAGSKAKNANEFISNIYCKIHSNRLCLIVCKKTMAHSHKKNRSAQARALLPEMPQKITLRLSVRDATMASIEKTTT